MFGVSWSQITGYYKPTDVSVTHNCMSPYVNRESNRGMGSLPSRLACKTCGSARVRSTGLKVHCVSTLFLKSPEASVVGQVFAFWGSAYQNNGVGRGVQCPKCNKVPTYGRNPRCGQKTYSLKRSVSAYGEKCFHGTRDAGTCGGGGVL